MHVVAVIEVLKTGLTAHHAPGSLTVRLYIWTKPISERLQGRILPFVIGPGSRHIFPFFYNPYTRMMSCFAQTPNTQAGIAPSPLVLQSCDGQQRTWVRVNVT
jgi:hypothetical protein